MPRSVLRMILFITRRFIAARRNSRSLSIFTAIAGGGIAIGVAALIIALSVLSGFENLVEEKLTGFESHIQIQGYSGFPVREPRQTEHQIRELLGTEIRSLYPVVAQLGILSSREVDEGVVIKGITAKNLSEKSSLRLLKGAMVLDSSSAIPPILLGRKLAEELQVDIGDKVTFFSVNGDAQNFSDMHNAAIDQFAVGGIFESGLAKFDQSAALALMDDVQQMLSLDSAITGFEIRLHTTTNTDSLTLLLSKQLPYPYYAKNIYGSNRHIFTWIALQKKPVPVLLGLIIIVAVFNIISTLLMIALEKTNATGILRTLGTPRKSIMTIFLLQGLFIGIGGIVAGNGLAALLMFLQEEWNLITLPSSVYFVSKVPLLFSSETFLLVSAITLPIVLLTSLIPSFIASRRSPLSTIRFQ